MAPTSYNKQNAEDDARGIRAFSRRQLDRVISPSTRQNLYAATLDFAQERPLFFAFLLFQLLFSFLPLVTFAVFALSLATLALGAAIVFSLFWIGIALLVLVPTLFLTSSIGLLVWVWAAGSFVVAKRLWALASHSPADHGYDGAFMKGTNEKIGANGNKEAGEKNGEKSSAVVVKEEEED
ncbi:hypothetical protein SODALDRAFT_327885 [Sodiomyces alkalinus F11]|uniref:Uncharacterized protein n=1 Tax=Sodiomyces alkalinus (strain CBS 110278 / VKM F-3762 / F11) TaxID=1314773 RepID=A0A3N2QA96_SODAK|nr:hypothetical protein SODALDRAFT_327885 [Sodiomyces alkalinus F11]ROT43683.1 hypothetical protein SODALDRAFT_327885 [Sodiomyces alkalinus F11]